MSATKTTLLCAWTLMVMNVACRGSGVTPPTEYDTGVATDAAAPTDVSSGIDATSAPVDASAGTDGTSAPQTLSLTALLEPATRPVTNTTVTVNAPAMVTLTPRFVSGKVTGNSSGKCRFVVWVGTTVGGNFTGIQLQHEANIGDAGDCNSVEDRYLSTTLTAGTAVTQFAGTYEEYCNTAGCMTGEAPTREIYLSGLVLGSTATVPAPTSVTVAQVAGSSTNPGPMALALEGTLVTVSNVHLTSLYGMTDAGTDTYLAVSDTAGGATSIQLDVSNFVGVSAVRDALNTVGIGGTVPSITGILDTSFDTWSIKPRQASDITGVSGITGGSSDAGM